MWQCSFQRVNLPGSGEQARDAQALRLIDTRSIERHLWERHLAAPTQFIAIERSPERPHTGFMSLDKPTQNQIESLLDADRVVLFMKGTREFPQCGFSAATTGILDRLIPEYTTVNVLEDDAIREGIKAFTDWPTIPQLYIEKEFVGGSDVVQEMFASGELQHTLGIEIPQANAPQITISDAASRLVEQARASQPEQALHLIVDARNQARLLLGPADESAMQVKSGELTFLMDPLSASRVERLTIELEDTPQGQSLRIAFE